MTTVKVDGREIAKVPTQGKWFEVNPLAIDQELFEWEREDKSQEITRQYILDAFVEVLNNPKYAKPFKTMFPEKTWTTKRTKELRELASKMGNHNADWVEQALEWAQRIHNGESWEDICNKPDTAKWFRVIVWKDGFMRFVGGSKEKNTTYPAADVECDNKCYEDDNIFETVPLIVDY